MTRQAEPGTDEGTVLFTARRLLGGAVGGMERFSSDVLDQLKPRFRVVDLACRGSRKVPVAYLARLPHRLRREARRVGLGAVDASDATLCGPAAASRLPSVARVHGLDLLLANPLYQAYLRRYLPKVTLLVANSEPTRRLLLDRGIPAARTRVVHPAARDPGHHQAHPPAEPRVLMVGRLVARKGSVAFVRDLWPRIVARTPDATLDIVGDGPERQALAAAVRASPHAASIRLHGRVPQERLERLYLTASVFAMPNQETPADWEGFGIVAAEAAVRGLPVVAYGVQGIADAVVPGATGTLVPAGQDEGFVHAVAAVLEDGHFRDRLAVRRAALERWSVQAMGDRYAEVVRQAMAGGGDPAA